MGRKAPSNERKPAQRTVGGYEAQRLGKQTVGVVLLPRQQVLREDASRFIHDTGKRFAEGLSPCGRAILPVESLIAYWSGWTAGRQPDRRQVKVWQI